MDEKKFCVSDIDLREADTSNIDAIIPMMKEFYEGEHLQFDEGKSRAALAEFLSDDSLGGAWMIFLQNEEAGYFCLTHSFILEYHGRGCLLDELYVLQKYRNVGIGNKVMEFIEEYARSHGLRSIHLETKLHNSFARDFYRRRGYKEHDSVFLSKIITV